MGEGKYFSQRRKGGWKFNSLSHPQDESNDSGFALYQNTPNPYKGEIMIRFKLPSATAATMTIFDVTGRMLQSIEGDYNAGYNEVRVRSEELSKTGVSYYQLDTDKFTATKKKILIN